MITLEQFMQGAALDYTTEKGHQVTATYERNPDLGVRSVRICPTGQKRALMNVPMTEDSAAAFYGYATADL